MHGQNHITLLRLDLQQAICFTVGNTDSNSTVSGICVFNVYPCAKVINILHIVVGSLHLFSTHVYEHSLKHNERSFTGKYEIYSLLNTLFIPSLPVGAHNSWEVCVSAKGVENDRHDLPYTSLRFCCFKGNFTSFVFMI